MTNRTHNAALLRAAGLSLLALVALATAPPRAPAAPETATPANATGERGLWKLWKLHEQDPTRHAELVQACTTLEQAAPQDPLAVVPRSLAAWHLLKAGDPAAAHARLEPLLEDRRTPLATAASDIARQWLTRLDRVQLAAALKDRYRQDVAFPESLAVFETLPPERRPPLNDRWGKPWEYKLIGFAHLPNTRDQKYELRSRLLGRDSDLNAALALPYASRLNLAPPTRMLVAGDSQIVEFKPEPGSGDDDTHRMSVGARSGRIYFAHMGAYLIVLSDGDCWKILPKPRR